MKQQAESQLDGYVQKAKQQGLENIETLVEQGSPKMVIIKHAAKKVNADLIICGATGIDAVEVYLNILRHMPRVMFLL